MRLIDADAVIEVQMYDEEQDNFYIEKMTVKDYICQYSEMPPTIDAVKVIRCKDCKYYTDKWCKRDSIHATDLNDRMVSENDYCSYAERRMNLDIIKE